jgi:hypothetical protein
MVLLGSAFVTGLSVALLGATASVFVAVPLVFLMGGSNTWAGLSLQVLIQAKVPGELMGRVFAFFVAILNVASPISAIWAGELAESVRIGSTFILFGLVIIITTTGLYFVSARLRAARY